MTQVPLLMQQQLASRQRMLERMGKAPPLAPQAVAGAAATSPEARPPAMKIDFEKFSGEPEDWDF